MRTILATTVVLAALGSTACNRNDAGPARREARETTRPVTPERDTVARKAGRAAYGVAQESKEAAKKTGRAVWKAGREAGAGWKEAQREARRP